MFVLPASSGFDIIGPASTTSAFSSSMLAYIFESSAVALEQSSYSGYSFSGLTAFALLLGGLGGGEVGRAKGTLNGLLCLIEPNWGILGRFVTPLKRILSDLSTIGRSVILRSTWC